MRDFYDWKKEVLRHVRFFFDHEAIEKELAAHYEDSVADFLRIGYDRDLAESRALTAMGDAEEVGRGLDRAHSPFLGWAWQFSRVLAVILVVMVLHSGLWIGDGWNIWRDFVSDEGRYQTEYVGVSEEKRGEYERVAVTSCSGTFERAGYTFSIPHAAIWKSDHEGTDIYWLSAAITAEDDRFWDNGPYYSAMTITSDWGKTWYGSWRNGDDSYFNGYTVERTPFREPVVLTACLIETPTKWLELDYPYGEGWTIRLEWEGIGE